MLTTGGVTLTFQKQAIAPVVTAHRLGEALGVLSSGILSRPDTALGLGEVVQRAQAASVLCSWLLESPAAGGWTGCPQPPALSSLTLSVGHPGYSVVPQKGPGHPILSDRSGGTVSLRHGLQPWGLLGLGRYARH